jgi:curved DNA-binding protein CbpA
MKLYFGERPGDDTGMRTSIFGPTGWVFLHSIAQNFPWRPTEEQKTNYYNFFKLVGNVLPCRYCRESYQKFAEEPGTLLSMDTVQDRKSMVTWLYKIHNKVNKKLGVKSHPTLKEVWNKYESFRSVCHKSHVVKKKAKGCTVPLNGVRKKCVVSIIDEKLSFGKKTKKIDDRTPEEIEQEIIESMNELGIQDRNNVSDIKQKYRRLSMIYHPDRPGGDQEKFKKISTAYSVLMNLNGTKFGKLKDSKELAYYKKMFYREDLRMLGVKWKDRDNMDLINKKYNEANDTSLKNVYKNIQEYHNKNSEYFKKKYKDLIKPTKVKKKYGKIPILKIVSFGKKVKGGKKEIKLISIKRSTKKGKKLMAMFDTNGRKKVIHFGAAGMGDLTKHKNLNRRNRFVFRHHKDLKTGDPSRAGFLSMFILWNKPSLQASIADYRRRLNVYNRTGKFPTIIAGYTAPGKK